MVQFAVKVILLDGHIVAEGSAEECAEWTYSIIHMDRMIKQKEIEKQAEKDIEALEKLSGMSFEELMKRESEGEE